MSPRSLFAIILKVLGIYLIKDILILIPSLLSLFSFFVTDSSTGFRMVAAILLTIILYGWISFTLIFKTDWVIDLFKLDQNFDEEILVINMHRSSILRIALMIIGGIMIIDAIPDICYQLINYWQQWDQASIFDYSTANLTPVIIPAVKLLVGLLLIGSTKTIVNFIELRRKK